MSTRIVQRFFELAVVAGVAGLGAPLFGQEAAPAVKPVAAAVVGADDQKIADLVKQLDAEEFPARQEASKELEALGEKAVAALEKATASDSSEVSMRSFDILRGQFEKGPAGAKEAARQALDRIAKADRGPASKRAGEILNPPAQSSSVTPVRPGIARAAIPLPAAGGIRIAGARVMIAGAAAGGGVETKIKIEDGVKTTEVKDKDRQVKIVEEAEKSLTVEVTEAADGKETTAKFEAKNAEEMKTKNPKAYEIYEKYAAKGAEFKIGGFGVVPGVVPALPVPVPLPIAPAPGFIPAPRLVPALPGGLVPVEPAPVVPAKKSLEGFEQLEKSLQEMEGHLKEAAKVSGDNAALKKAQDRLDEVRKQLEVLRSSMK